MSIRQRLCHISSVHGPADQRIVHRECASLAAAGYDVVYVCPGDAQENIEGVRVVTVARASGGRATRMTATVARVVTTALRQGAAVYHVHDPELLPSARVLSALGHRVIYDAHEDLPKDVAIKTYLPGWARGLIAGGLYVGEPVLARGLDAVVVPVDYMAGRFATFGVRRVVTIQNFPVLSSFASTPPARLEPEGPIRVVYVGSLSYFRGIGIDVDAMGRLPSDSKARLLLYGTCDPPTLIDELRSKPGWARSEYAGFLPHQHLPRALANAHIGLATLQPTEAYMRALPTKLFEYMACGLPVIASAFPIWKDFIEKHDCGICVDPVDPVAIAAAIHRLSCDPAERARLGANGRRASVAFSWAEESRKIVALYDELLAGS